MNNRGKKALRKHAVPREIMSQFRDGMGGRIYETLVVS